MSIIFLILLSVFLESTQCFRIEAYWDSSYVIPPERSCEDRQSLFQDTIDIWSHVPSEFRTANLTINIAFADFDPDRCWQRAHSCRELVCGLKLFEDGDEDLLAGLVSSIKQVQAIGARVKLSFGGIRYGNLNVPTKTTSVAERIVDSIVRNVLSLGVDGVDLVQKEGCGYRNMRCDDQTSIHLHLLEGIRKKLPAGKVLSYTFPVSVFSDRLDFPYIDVVKYGLGYLDSISMLVMPSARAPTSNKTIQSVLDLGVPPSKIIWGFSKGCQVKKPRVQAPDVKKIVSQVQTMGLAGVAMWNLNNDEECNHMSQQPLTHDYFRAIAAAIRDKEKKGRGE